MPTLHNLIHSLMSEMGSITKPTLTRLLVAAVLGGAIGLQRQIRHKPAGLRTNIFICFGAAMFTILSQQLAGGPGESARIASNIITGIGFIGAGSILHSRGSVTGLTTAATIFVVASVGMACGGGLYVTAVFATVLMLLVLGVLGRVEGIFSIKTLLGTYEVTGASAEAMMSEVNRVLEDQNLASRNVHLASAGNISRLVFSVEGGREEHNLLSTRLHESNVFASVATIGSTERE
jgi:putative Mg2+ transporter-C (MgtC) family protein